MCRERGEEKERQQKNQVLEMETRLEDSEREADRMETKLSLMESVLAKLKGRNSRGFNILRLEVKLKER